MKLLLDTQRRAMVANHQMNYGRADTIDLNPVVKLFCPWMGATWLLSELDEDDVAFGLCDLGMGEPELGYVSLAELAEIKHWSGLGIERDRHFRAKKTMTEYADEARAAGRIKA